MTVPEPAFHISLYSKRTITQFRIVTCKSQIANSMQILFVNQLPVFSQLFFPLLTHLLVLRHNMLNGVLIYVHSFFTPVILQLILYLACALEVIYITYF